MKQLLAAMIAILPWNGTDTHADDRMTSDCAAAAAGDLKKGHFGLNIYSKLLYIIYVFISCYLAESAEMNAVTSALS